MTQPNHCEFVVSVAYFRFLFLIQNQLPPFILIPSCSIFFRFTSFILVLFSFFIYFILFLFYFFKFSFIYFFLNFIPHPLFLCYPKSSSLPSSLSLLSKIILIAILSFFVIQNHPHCHPLFLCYPKSSSLPSSISLLFSAFK